MPETSARLLRLLSLLQSRRDWGGTELAGRLGVGLRTVRRDIGRLRDLGYPVDAAPGVAGGYQLGLGAVLPPLLLDDEEAVAVAISLHMAAAGSVAGLEETSLRALTKLSTMLPSRLRHRVSAFRTTTVPLTGAGSRPDAVDPELLTAIAAACRDQRRLRLRYPVRGRCRRAQCRAVPPGPHHAPLVPAGLGHRSRRLANLPPRPHPRAARPARGPLHGPSAAR